MKLGLVSLLFCSIFSLAACSEGSSDSSTQSSSADSTSNLSQSAMAETNSQASASESSTMVGFVANQSTSGGKVHALSACSYSTVRSSCSSSQDTITWGGCTIASGLATLTGSWTETFTGTSHATCTVPIVSGETVTRTTTGSVITGPLGGAITTDTNGGNAYDGTTIGASGTSISNSSGTRTISVDGTHRVAVSAAGKTIYDHFIVTGTPLTVTGSLSGGTRAVTAGTMTVYHNLAKYQASFSFHNVTWTNSSCCYPTTGYISGTLSGSLIGNTTLTFSTTCGQASFTDTTGTTTSLTLSQCN